MRWLVLSVLLLTVASAVGAPAPFPKSPPPSAKRVWLLDLRPLSAAPVGAFKVKLTLVARMGDSAVSRIYLFLAKEGKVQAVYCMQSVETPSKSFSVVGQVWSVIGLPPGEAIKNGLLDDLGDGAATDRGAVVEVNALGDQFVSEVTVAVEGLAKEFAPIARRAPRAR